VVVVTTILAFLIGMAMFGALVFMPVYLQVVRGSSPTASGLQLSPLMFGMIVTSIASGRLITRLGRYRAFPIAGALFITLGVFLLSRLEADSAPILASAFLVVVGIGLGLSMQVLTLAAQNAVEMRDLGIATSSNTFFRSMGGALGVAIFGSVFSSRLASHLAERFPDFAERGGTVVEGGPEAIRSLPDALRTPVIAAFADALQDVFLLAAPVGAAAFVVALFLRDLPLREHVESPAGPDVVAPADTRGPQGRHAADPAR